MSIDPERAFLRRLEEADQQLQEERPSPDLDRRIEETLARAFGAVPPRQTRQRWVLAAAASGLAALALLVLAGESPVSTPSGSRAHVEWKAVELPDAGVFHLEDEGVRIASIYPGRLLREKDGFRLETGLVRFVVAPRPRGPPLRLRAGPLLIEVIGTVFTVDVRAEGGHVWLEKGQIDIVDSQGRREHLSAGDVRGWGDSRVQWPEKTTEQEIGEVLRLEQNGRGDEARLRLARMLRRPIDPPAAEAASFEFGLLTPEPDVQCQHWRRHQLRFSGGSYAGPVARALSRCPGGNSTAPRE